MAIVLQDVSLIQFTHLTLGGHWHPTVDDEHALAHTIVLCEAKNAKGVDIC